MKVMTIINMILRRTCWFAPMNRVFIKKRTKFEYVSDLYVDVLTHTLLTSHENITIKLFLYFEYYSDCEIFKTQLH